MQNRRGAIVVMTGIFIIALMLMAAISVDASRILAAKNELQTASDAAALAGALQLLSDSSTALDTAFAYAKKNRVEQRIVDSAEVEVDYGVWFPSERSFDASGRPADAVRVTIRHALPLSLARVFGDSTITVTSSAVAWSSAPVAEAACAKPLAVPYSELLKTLGYPEGYDVNLTADDIRALREMSEDQRNTHFHFGDPNLGADEDGVLGGHYARAQYFPIDIDSTWNRSDPITNDRPSVPPNTFQSYLAGGRCGHTVQPGDMVRSEPSDKREAVRDGLSDICQAKGGLLTGSTVLRCVSVADGESIRLPLQVIFWTGEFAGWNGARALLEAKMTGSFVLAEFQWEPADSSGRGQHARMAGHWDVNRAFGPISATSSSTLVRTILVR